jgi:hypothetical protein
MYKSIRNWVTCGNFLLFLGHSTGCPQCVVGSFSHRNNILAICPRNKRGTNLGTIQKSDKIFAQGDKTGDRGGDKTRGQGTKLGTGDKTWEQRTKLGTGDKIGDNPGDKVSVRNIMIHVLYV